MSNHTHAAHLTQPVDVLRPGAEPFYLAGSRTGMLLIHGFTGSTRDMRALGEALQADGLTVCAVRLAHHGTQARDMTRAHWRDWVASALDGYHLLRSQCDHVFVAGLSMGGVLALRLAAQYPVAGAVSLSAPSLLFHQRSGWRPRFANLYSTIFRYVIKDNVDVGLEYSGSYPVFPTYAVGQFYELLKETDTLLPNVTAPTLLIHSQGDTFIAGENLLYLRSRLTGTPAEMFWLQRTEHVVTLAEGEEQALLFDRIRDFIKATTPVSP
jgi:carboxylesterase